jgi:hypothetical protein
MRSFVDAYVVVREDISLISIFFSPAGAVPGPMARTFGPHPAGCPRQQGGPTLFGTTTQTALAPTLYPSSGNDYDELNRFDACMDLSHEFSDKYLSRMRGLA